MRGRTHPLPVAAYRRRSGHVNLHRRQDTSVVRTAPVPAKRTITIRPEHEQLIAQAIQTGAYQNLDDVIGRALELLRSEDECLAGNKPVIGEKIERGFGQFERGEFFSPEQSRADMQKRKAEWLRKQGG